MSEAFNLSLGGEPAGAVVAWMLDTLVTPIVERGKDWKWSRDERARWEKALDEYRTAMVRHHGKIKVLGREDDFFLGDIFTDVYILDKVSAYRRFNLEELRSKTPGRDAFHLGSSDRKNGLGIVNQGENLYILGKPGAGKTTFLKYITLRLNLGGLTNPRLPIFVSLHEWSMSGQGDLLRFIVDRFDEYSFPNAEGFIVDLLKNGRALLLFDGLDEVRKEEEQRAHLAGLLQSFARKYHQCQHVITCRVAADEYRFEDFRYVEIADFSQEQVERYVNNWFADEPQVAKQLLEKLTDPNHAGLRELCNVPLLLSLLCLYFGQTLDFPPGRAELYEDALDMLLRQWDTKRRIQRDQLYLGLSIGRRRQLLAYLAGPAFEQGQYYFSTRELSDRIAGFLAKLPGAGEQDDIDGEGVLIAIEAHHGLLVERAHNIHSFSHLTIQEYFTARHLVDEEMRGAVVRAVNAAFGEARWNEVFLFAAELLPSADGFFKAAVASIHATAQSDFSLLSVLKWADRYSRTGSIQDGQPLTVIRIAYLVLSLPFNHLVSVVFSLVKSVTTALEQTHIQALAGAMNLTFSLNRARDLSVRAGVQEHEFETDLDRASAFALALQADLAHIFDQVRDSAVARAIAQTSELDLVRAIELDRAISIARGLENPYGSTLGIAYGLYFAAYQADILAEFEGLVANQRQRYLSAFPQLVAMVMDTAKHRLKERFVQLQTPQANGANDDWRRFAAELGEILDEFLSWPDMDVRNRINVPALDEFLLMNTLLMQCLCVASVSDRNMLWGQVLAATSDAEERKAMLSTDLD